MLSWFDDHVLSVLIFLPLLSACVVAMAPTRALGQALALGASLLTFVFSLHVWCYFDVSSAGLQFVENYAWLPSFGIRYFVGVDGLSIMLLMLTTFLTPCLVISLWNKDTKNPKALLALLLFLQSGMVGALVAMDMVFFYVFWEIMLIPMYFIIGLWGGANRIYATTKFVIYTVFGSLLMLVAAIALYLFYFQKTGQYSTSLLDLYNLKDLSAGTQCTLFAAFALAFAIKVPLFPFHTWLPHAHTEAPTSGSVILAGVLLKMGTYGFLRFALPLFPLALQTFAPVLLALGAVGIAYGALVAWVQVDAKRLVAYSSVSHLGFVIIGSVAFVQNQLSQEALTGAVYQMINHGISTGALFFLVGVIYERRHTRMLSDFGGLAAVMPTFAVCLIIATMGSVGLPGTGGFVGEFLILLGVFQSSPVTAVVAASGVVLGAVYMLTFCLKILFGPITHEENKTLSDLTFNEKAYLYPLCALIVVMGVAPNYFLSRSRASLEHFARHVSDYSLDARDSTVKPESQEEKAL
jgi:NADH-quinone oxidoreductase subunit M